MTVHLVMYQQPSGRRWRRWVVPTARRRYPSNSGGSGFQNQYEESTPVCDAVVVDIKLHANLDQPSWNSPLFQLMNAGAKTQRLTYLGEGNQYGEFTDPYLVANGLHNPHKLLYTAERNPSPMPKQSIDVNFVESDGIGVGSKFIEPSSGLVVGNTGLTAGEQALRDVQIAESTN